jgi:hypothetical protein
VSEDPINDTETLDEAAAGGLPSIWQRIVLTWRYHGPWSVAYRVVTFPCARRRCEAGSGSTVSVMPF